MAGAFKKYQTMERGTPNSTNYRMFFKNEDDLPVSPFHDIPLYANDAKTVYNMVVEIPRWTNAKMEISLTEYLNPIKQDVRNGELRFIGHCFPFHGYIWNYGVLPQTWENPILPDPFTGYQGDSCPVNVLEIGSRVAKRGNIVQVKILGTIALLDEDKTDWKVIAIDVNDPIANQLHDIDDVNKVYPGLLSATVKWFKIYQVPDGKQETRVGFNGEAKNSAFAANVVGGCHLLWRVLIYNELEDMDMACLNTTLEGSPHLIAADAAEAVISESFNGGKPEPISDDVDKWYFITTRDE